MNSSVIKSVIFFILLCLAINSYSQNKTPTTKKKVAPETEKTTLSPKTTKAKPKPAHVNVPPPKRSKTKPVTKKTGKSKMDKSETEVKGKPKHQTKAVVPNKQNQKQVSHNKPKASSKSKLANKETTGKKEVKGSSNIKPKEKSSSSNSKINTKEDPIQIEESKNEILSPLGHEPKIKKD